MGEYQQRRYLKHQVPPWLDLDAYHCAFFVTICCKRRGTNQLADHVVWSEMLEAITNRMERGVWHCDLFLAMPDHVHGLFRFEGEESMSKAFTDWKRWTSSKLGVEWQRGFFDHRLRSHESGEGKRNYILANPVRAGLVEKIEDWEFVFDYRG
ncbi:transposase [Haloferula sp.]|uniref:transposase n=1 Tax=Haloferula sp. TaxID=2497595 RepID=UPI00329AA6CA